MLKLVQGQKLVMAGRCNSSGLNEVMKLVIVNETWAECGRDVVGMWTGYHEMFARTGVQWAVLSVGRD